MKVLILLAISAILAPAVYADDDYLMDTSSIGRSHNGVVNSNQFLELGMHSANALRMEGENCLRSNELDRALMLLQRSVEMAPADIDGRILYGQALEQKLISQKERDPALFNFCIKQWLYVAKKSEFPDQAVQGYSHLSELTGIAPKMWESEKKYLAKVLLPVDGSTKVAIGNKKKVAAKKNSDDKDL